MFIKVMIDTRRFKNWNKARMYRRILRYTSWVTGVSKKKILSKSRKDEIVQARQICHYLAYGKKLVDDWLKVVGHKFGGVHHSTVLFSCKKIKNLLDCPNEKTLIEQVNKIEKLLMNTFNIKIN